MVSIFFPMLLGAALAWAPPKLAPRRLGRLRAHKAFKQAVDPRYTLESAVAAGEAGAAADVPQTFDGVLAELGASVAAATAAAGADARFVVECLPPGLNPELEATCPYSPSRELAVVLRVLECLPYAAVRVACASSGDAAMTARALDGLGGLDGVSYCGLGGAEGAGKDPAAVLRRVFGDAPAAPDCVVVVRPRNAVGDAVIEDVRVVAEAAAGPVILVNPDLGEKVSLGIAQKERWAAFVRTFRPLYHFSNLCAFERPSCRQMERGCLRYTPARGWETFAVIPLLDATHGDLRRYNAFPDAPAWPFLLAATDDARPGRDDVARRTSHGAKLAKVLRAADPAAQPAPPPAPGGGFTPVL